MSLNVPPITFSMLISHTLDFICCLAIENSTITPAVRQSNAIKLKAQVMRSKISRVRLTTRLTSIIEILGTFSDIQRSILYEFFLISFFASSLGSGISIIVSYLISKFIFDGLFSYNFLIPLGITSGVTVISVLIAYFNCSSTLKEKPMEILRSN